ncbi:unnamed protein product, partial [Candidula unifasciata]
MLEAKGFFFFFEVCTGVMVFTSTIINKALLNSYIHRALHYSEKDWAQKSVNTMASLSPDLPSTIDSAISGRYWGRNNQTYFFKGCNYWILDNGVASGPSNVDGPNSIDFDFPGLPCNIDAALNLNDTVYFFQNNN